MLAEGVVARFRRHTDEYCGQARPCGGVESVRIGHVEDVSAGAARWAFELAVEYVIVQGGDALCVVLVDPR